MGRGSVQIDIAHVPSLAWLVDELERTHQPQAIQRNGETVALLVPVSRRRREHRMLVDTGPLPAVPYASVAELVRHQPVPVARSFTDDELKGAAAEARAEAWRAKPA